jgi:uncharacterized protein DUF4390
MSTLPGSRRHESTTKKAFWFSSWLSACLRAFVVAAVFLTGVQAADGVPDITVTLMARDGQVVVSFEMTEAFTPDVRDAIQSGLPTTFSYDVALRRAGLLERTVASVAISATVRFDNLTRRYQMSRSVDGRLEDARPTEDLAAARAWMTRFERVPLSETASLETNGEYFVRVRAHTRPHNTWFFWPWSGTTLGQARFTFIQ